MKGDFYVNKNPYKLKNLGVYHEHCSHCGLKYEREIHFFYGAMYASYALNVGGLVIMWAVSELIWDEVDVKKQILVIASILLILAPITYYWSKLIWLNLFVKYDDKIEAHIEHID